MVNIQHTLILKSGINILIGSLWLWWIYQLGKKENNNKKCKEIQPHLRIFLKILAWVLLIACFVTIIVIVFNFNKMNEISVYTRSFVIIAIILMALIYVVQLKYINDIETANSNDKTGNNCEGISISKKIFIIMITVLILASAVLNIIRHSKSTEGSLKEIIVKNAKRKRV